jgi:hypothetical protein
MIRFADLPVSGRVRCAAAVLAAAVALAGCQPDRETMLRRLHEDNPRVQVETIARVVNAGDRTMTPELFRLLESEDEGVRFAAAAGLHTLTGRDFGFHRARTADERRRIIGQWRAWWEAEGAAAPAPPAEGAGAAGAGASSDAPKARGT